MTDAPEVLFVCVHNAGRSQMAAALLDHYAEGRVRVHSAGSAPAEEINPAVLRVMAELGPQTKAVATGVRIRPARRVSSASAMGSSLIPESSPSVGEQATNPPLLPGEG